MANVEDLRYVRTEASIRAAFMEMVAKQPVASVTASAVCCRAGISRNAFYLHHASIAGLYATLVSELVEDVRAEGIASAERRALTGRDDALNEAIVNALAKHEDMLRAFLPSDNGTLAKRLAEGVEESFVEAAMRFGKHGGSLEHRLRCAYSAWAMVGMVLRWVSSTDRPIVELTDQFDELHSGVVQASANYLMASVRK